MKFPKERLTLIINGDRAGDFRRIADLTEGHCLPASMAEVAAQNPKRLIPRASVMEIKSSLISLELGERHDGVVTRQTMPFVEKFGGVLGVEVESVEGSSGFVENVGRGNVPSLGSLKVGRTVLFLGKESEKDNLSHAESVTGEGSIDRIDKLRKKGWLNSGSITFKKTY